MSVKTPCDMLALERESLKAEVTEMYEILDKMPSGVPLWYGCSNHTIEPLVCVFEVQPDEIGSRGYWRGRRYIDCMEMEQFRRRFGFVMQPGELCRIRIHAEKMSVED